jgi:hypothetical protein
MQGMPGADCLRQSDPDALAFDDVGKKTETAEPRRGTITAVFRYFRDLRRRQQ